MPNITIAIDFGTSRSGYAYRFDDWEPDTCVYRDTWPDNPLAYPKTATRLLIDVNDPDRKVIAWGHTATKKFSQLNEDQKQSYYLAKNFKMDLYQDGADNTQSDRDLTIKQGRKKIKVLNLISKFLGILKLEILRDLNSSTGQEINQNQIKWRLTVPAIWTESQKDLMRKTAEQAGLVNPGEYDRLDIILEPEAAAIYCQSIDSKYLQPGTKFLVADCGGGTLDMTIHEVTETGTLREIAPGSGGPLGSTYVDKNFEDYLETRLTQKINEFKKQSPSGYQELLEDWERIKCLFDPDTEEDIIYLQLKVQFYNFLKSKRPSPLKKLQEEQNGDDTTIHIKKTDILSIFNPIVAEIVSAIDSQIKQLNLGLNAIFLVGGFSESPLLRNTIKQEFETDSLKVITPPKPGLAVLKGAVIYEADKTKTITSRIARYTYGYKTCKPFEEDIDPEYTRTKIPGEQDRCCSRFNKLITIGEECYADEPVTKYGSPVYKDQTKITYNFYRTSKQNPRYTLGNDITQIGTLEVPVKDHNDEACIYAYFGQTEINIYISSSVGNYETRLKYE